MKGKLLIATPDLLSDQIFSKSVILIADVHQDGKVGFILNKPIPLTLKEISDIKASFQLFNGGPVAPDRLYFLHKIPDAIPGGLPVYDGLYWGGDFAKVKSLIENNESRFYNQIRFFIGYSGWGSGQLEREIRNGTWVVSKRKIDIFNLNPKHLWQKLLIETRPDLELWKNAPDRPELN